MEGNICQWPLPSQAGLHKRSFSPRELPSIGQDLSPASQRLAQLLGFTPKRLPLTEAEDKPNLDKMTLVDTASLRGLEWMVGSRVLKVFYPWPMSLGETHKGYVKRDQGEGTLGQLNPALDDKRHLVSPPGPGPSKSVLQQKKV